jgi:hypothetical protein
MDTARIATAVDSQAVAVDTLARSLCRPLPRRRVFGLLAGAFAASALGVSRRDAEAAGATSIPPNCIYVCCDGTCDSWKMCLRCVKWPKATTTATAIG